MDKNKKTAIDFIDTRKDLIADVADQIWGFAELSLEEYKSAALYCEVLEKEGFAVEKGISGIETAFSASYGSGKPVIGILAEYDALSGISQKAGVCTEDPIIPGGNGHGCGHNLLGAGAMAAALGVKKYLEETGTPGTVVLFGCPGEEGGASKAFMARDGVWKNIDAALTWHPADENSIGTGSCNSCITVQYTYHGIASHASGAPEKGRSALDAVELMNIGVQFLREHMDSKARIHYAITDGGGRSPNVVQPKATVLYMVRSNHVGEAIKLQERVDKIAEGAALMTETTYERKFIDGCSDTVTNHVLEALAYKNFEELGVPAYTEAEYAFADELAKTFDSETPIPGVGSEYDPLYRAKAKALKEAAPHALNDFLLPLYTGEAFGAGSTDVGDVSQLTPAMQVYVAAWPNGCPGHSWQNVSSGGTSIGHKAAVHAGKVICGTAIDLFEQPETLAAAREEFFARTAEHPYVCPIPEGAVPTLAD